MVTYNEENLKVLSTLLYKNIDDGSVDDKFECNLASTGNFEFGFKELSDVLVYSACKNITFPTPISPITKAKPVGKAVIHSINASEYDLAQIVDNTLCEMCVMIFKQNPMKFDQVDKKDFKEWVKNCGDGVLHCNEATGNLLGVKYYKTSLPNGTAMFTPGAEFAGVVPYKLGDDGVLEKFGILLHAGSVKFAHVIGDE